ncbi:MAG TPA: lytic murein transglycosylase [Candidatus Paceibacterota bacterium]|nr:lytic murein transglycosylase [Candidatus Paceibacterota bacterium]
MLKIFKSFFQILIALVLLLAVSFSPFYWQVSAQSDSGQAVNPNLTPEQRAALEAQLAQIESEIAAQQKILDQTKAQGRSISSDIASLNAQIKQAQLKIQAHTIAINQLGHDITIKTQVIDNLNQHISAEQQSLANVIRQLNQLDSYSLAEAMLSRQDLSSFLLDMDTLSTLNSALKQHVDQVEADKNQNEQQQQVLSQKKDQEVDTRADIQAEQNKIKVAETQKQQLLNLNKSEQQNYQSVLTAKQAQAAKIRNQLFVLRDVPAIKFGDALIYAQAAQKATGVDPAFLLAIITQESNLGANVGACYLLNSTGQGTKISTGATVSNLMKPDRDVAPFLEITAAVGRDPYHTKVSCPIGNSGYGGAMGPAQFIASTWKLNQARIAAAVGKNVADPWNPQDAFMASALYLSDLGAVGGSYSAEIRAACKYYGSGGSSCSYGTQVMAKVQSIQSNIDILASS